MADFETMEELKEQASEGQIEVVTLQQLREALGYKKLGPRVLSDVSQKLAGQGLGYFPRYVIDDNDLPRAWEEVRIYLKDSPVGKVIQAVLDPTETGDQYLLEASGSDNSAAEILDRIRALLGE
jgi:hypothetical protein